MNETGTVRKWKLELSFETISLFLFEVVLKTRKARGGPASGGVIALFDTGYKQQA